MLKLKTREVIGKAYSEDEKKRMLKEAAKARSPHIYFALTLALNAGMRDGEIKQLTWAQVNFAKKYLAVGRAKTPGGEGRTIPLNSELFAVLSDYAEWYKHKFGAIRPEWYVFPFGKPQPTDPTRHITTLKTVWTNIRAKANVKGRWHDNRHTLITELAESGATDQTRPSWTLPVMSPSRCSSITATFEWKRTAMRWRRWCKSEPQQQPKKMARSSTQNHP